MDNDEYKRAAAHAALDELPAEGIIGIGTGSTVRFFLQVLQRGDAVRTDGGNMIYDLHVGPIATPRELEAGLIGSSRGVERRACS